mgnify:CR=1 FL=1
MSFKQDLTDDLDEVFFGEEFAVHCLLQRAAGGEAGITCIIETGIDRFINDAYVKNKWDATFKVSDNVKQNDVIQVLGEDGMPTAHYIIGDLVSREGDTKIYEAVKKKLV